MLNYVILLMAGKKTENGFCLTLLFCLFAATALAEE
jgi:hypothetical protein